MDIKGFVQEQLMAFAQKLYDEHQSVGNVTVHVLDQQQSFVIVYDTQGRQDRFWIVHPSPDVTQWTWAREYNGA